MFKQILLNVNVNKFKHINIDIKNLKIDMYFDTRTIKHFILHDKSNISTYFIHDIDTNYICCCRLDFKLY